MNIISILLTILGAAPKFVELFLAITTEVHRVQQELPGAPGADKSARVIDKVTPIASVVGAEVPHVQELINQVVSVSKEAGLGAFGTTDNAGG